MEVKEQKPYDIAKSGPQSYRLLQEQNAQNFKIDAPTSKEYLYEKNQANAYLGHSMYNAVEAAPTVVQSPLYGSNTKLGQSYFDQDVYNKEEFENAGDVRAENQPAIIQAINGTTKGAILAGTTALSGILGIPYGIASAAVNHDFSKLWDNDVTRTAQAINDASEEWLPNYYTKQQTEGSWYSPSNILSANFIFDKVIKNIGFTVGAAYSGGLYTKGIDLIAKGIGGLRAMALTGKTFKEAAELGARAMNMSNATRVTKALVGSVFSATAEGTIEALNHVKDYVDIYRQKVDAHTAEGINDAYREFAINGGQFDGNGNPILDNTSKSLILQDKLYKLQRAKEQAYKEIDATRANMGNADFIANLPILTLGNWFTLGKMFAGGYKAARNISKVTTRATKEAMAAAKAEGKEAVERLNNIVKKAKKTGYQGLTDEEKALVEEGTNHLLGDKTYAALMAAREPLKEGFEEMTQAAAAKSSQNYYGSRVDAIYDAAMDNNSRDQVLNWWQASMQGFKDIYGDFNNYEEGFIGALTGLMGSPTFGKKNNSTSETYLGRSKWIGMSGGVVPQWRNAIKGRQDEAEIVSHVNRILKNGNLERDIKHLIAQTSFDNKQKVAAIRNDKMSFKDSELASIFENIMYLKEAGKIDLLNRAIDNMDGFTEEDAKSILDLTKKEIGLNGGNLNALTKRREELVAQSEELTKQKEAALKGIESFRNSTTLTPEESAKIQVAEQTVARIDETVKNIGNTIEDIDKQLKDKKSSVVSPYLNENGDLKTPTEVLEDLNKRKEKHKKILKFVTGAMDSIDASTNEALTNDQLKTLTWYKVMMLDWKDRANSMGTSLSRFVREFLNDQDAIEKLARLDEELKGVDVKHLTKEELQTYGGAIVSRNILKNIIGGSKSIVKLLEDIQSNSKEDMGLALARLLNEEKETEIDGKKQKVGDYLFNSLKTTINANAAAAQDEKENFITTLSDLRKIGENYSTYNKLLKEYMKNPSEIDKAHQDTLNKAEREANNKKSKKTKDSLRFDGSIGDLTKDLRDNREELENIGADEFKNSLDENQLEAFNEAEKLLDGIDSIEHKINTSDLEDEVKKAMLANLDDSIEGVNNIDELLEKLSSLDPSEALERALEAGNLDDIAKLDRIEELEAQYREFIDQDLSKVADAIEAKRKAQIKDIEEKAKKAADALDEAEEERVKEPKERKLRVPKERKKGENLANRKKANARNKARKEEQPKSRPSVEEDKEAVKKQGTNSDIANRNARRKKVGYSSNFANRPQLSETFFYGRDLLTYVQYIKENPSRIPKFVASKLFPGIKTQEDFIKAYTKYIEATYQYLKDNGAFEYVKHNLKANDKLVFTVDEELNNKAGVPVVIIKAVDKEGNSHVVGTMKTELDFMSINTKTDLTYGTTEAAQKKLYDEIVYKYKASKVKSSQKQNVKSSTEQSEDKFNFSTTSGTRENRYEVTPHKKIDKDGNTVITYSAKVTYVKGAPKGHQEGEVRTLEDGNGFTKLDFDDIDFAEYAAGDHREDGTIVTKDEVDKEDIKKSREIITNLLTDLLSNKLNTTIRKIIIAKDGRVFVDFQGKDLRVPLKKEAVSKYLDKYSSQSKDDLIHITNTSQGYSNLGKIQEWSKKTADVRTEPDGFGVKNGLTYFKKSHEGGRGGDNITIWFRDELSQSIKEKIPKLLDESKDLNEFGDKVTELINTESLQINNEEFVGTEATIVKPTYFSSMEEQLGSKKSSWEYYRDNINRTYGGIEYVTGVMYQATLEPAIKFAIDSRVLPIKYRSYLGKTRENAIEKSDLQEIINELKSLEINNPSELIEYVDRKSQEQVDSKEFVGAESSVKRLMGGDVAFSDTESSISSIFNNTGSTIIFGVVNDSGMISTTNSSVDSKILQVDVAKAKEGQVYVLIPSNNGSLLPALCYGDVIEDLLEKPNDWYIEETIKAIQSLTNIAQIGSNKNNVAKWLGISTQTINVSVGHLGTDNKFTEDTDITNADRIRVAYNDAKGERKYIYIALSDDKTISHDNAKKFIESFASRFSIDSHLTVNLNTQRLMDKDYINNMSKYYFTNIVQGQTHSVNDWFTYNKTQTEIDNEPKERKPVKPTKKPTETTPTGAPKTSKDVTVGDNTYTTTSDGRVYDEEDKLVVGEERTKVLDETNKPQEEPKEEPTEKQEEKDKQEKQEEKPVESVDLASQILGGAKRGKRRAKPKEENEDKKKDDDNKPEINQDQIDTTRTRQSNNRRRRPIKPSSESSESTSTAEPTEPKKTVRQRSIDKAISIFPNMDKSRIEGVVNRIFDAVEGNEGAMQILDDIKTVVSFFKKVSTPIANISTRAYNNFINAVLDPMEREKLNEESSREFNVENKDFNLRTMEVIDKVSSALREYLDGYVTIKSKALLNIFKIIKSAVDSLGKNMIVLNNFFNNILAETTSIIIGETGDSATEDLRVRYAYSNLSNQVKSWLHNRGTNIDAYNRLSPQQQESYIRCMI